MDSSQTALKYLKDTRVSINSILIMTENFNIHDSLWDLIYLFHSSHSNIIFNVIDAFDLDLSAPTNCIPTRYMVNEFNLNLVIDLMFPRHGLEEFDNHHIHLD